MASANSMQNKHSSTDSKIPLFLFAKAPKAGDVKTRMHPQLSHQQCAQLASLLLRKSAYNAAQYWPGDVIVAYSGDVDNEEFLFLRQQYGFDFVAQGEGDLGQRMARCLRKGIAEKGAAAVIGCDMPYLEAAIYHQAYTALVNGDNIIGPALDGGFYLLGTCQFNVNIFNAVDWGTSHVFSQVMHNAKLNQWALTLLEEKRDIDHWDDLLWISQFDKAYQSLIEVDVEADAVTGNGESTA